MNLSKKINLANSDFICFFADNPLRNYGVKPNPAREGMKCSQNCMDEKYLLKRMSIGDREAFSIIFRMYYGKMLRFLSLLIEDEAAAKDLSQDIFLRLWNNRRTLTIRSLENYLFVASRNACRDYLKAAGRASVPLDDIGASHTSSLASPEEQLDASLLNERIMKILDKMPARRKEVFMLSRLKGESNEQIAKQLGISKKTVENHISSVLGILRKIS